MHEIKRQYQIVCEGTPKSNILKYFQLCFISFLYLDLYVFDALMR